MRRIKGEEGTRAVQSEAGMQTSMVEGNGLVGTASGFPITGWFS